MPTLHEIADRFEPKVRSVFLSMVASLAASPDNEQLERLLKLGDVAGILQLFQDAYASRFAATILPVQGVLTETAQAAGASTFAGINLTFDVASTVTQDWLYTKAGRLVTGVSDQSIVGMRTVLGASYEEGLGARWAARQIRSLVGLTPEHAMAVARYEKGLHDQGVPLERVQHFTRTYAQRLVNYRADVIARTESMTAAHVGQYEAWRQQFASGILQRDRTWIEWVLTEDDRLCPWCAPMAGQRVRFTEYFSSTHKGFPDGKPEARGPGSKRVDRNIRPDPWSQPRDSRGRFTRIGFAKRDKRDELDGLLVELRTPRWVQYPPLHPNCRCTLRLRFDK